MDLAGMRSPRSPPNLDRDNRDDGQVERKGEEGDGERERRTAFAQVDEILRRVGFVRTFFGQLRKRVSGGCRCKSHVFVHP